MRPRTLSNVLTFVTAGTMVTASPPVHQHHRHANHVEERSPKNVETVSVPGPTVVAYKLNGETLSEEEVCNGINDGSLQWVDGTGSGANCATRITSNSHSSRTSSATVHVSSTEPISSLSLSSMATYRTTSQQLQALKQTGGPGTSISKVSSQQSSPHVTLSSSTRLPTTTASQSSSTLLVEGIKPDRKGLEMNFPDNTVSCSDFPSGYGPMKVDWAELGGWTGIQYVTIKGNSITHIDTAVPGGNGCKPGAMCSYACPPGYQKSQWPSAQGATGQSVGGLWCNQNGKLSLTNPTLSQKLCIPGTGATIVENKLSNNAAICRTDYPGKSFNMLNEDGLGLTLKIRHRK